ncbi:terminase gpA endonuclease subunit [Desulfatitalea tepidiphila]|uniref:terminase gpA endonuclease subunit n=1 Tax=Desulfatitalea tepidiphila TaxID=1185843 RepID=UPI0006B482DC|nr:terminase gpA endonuclease subunit [Desulfatitalea tepidiphila]
MQGAASIAPRTREGLFFENEARLWEPGRDLAIVEWVESRRQLGARSEEKGPMRLERTPYIVPWLEAAVDPNLDEVVVCKSAQVAGTEFGLSVVGYYADQRPCPILITMADENTATYIARDRVKKMFEDSPELAYLVQGATVSNANELELANGAYINVAWASSVAALGTKPFKIVINDEIDKPGYYTKTKEASPLSLSGERTETFYEFKHIKFSTPTLETGNIFTELMSCDAVYDWHVPCPYCGVMQPLRWSAKYTEGFKGGVYRDIKGKKRKLGGVVWKGGSKATRAQIMGARYQCGACGRLWTTAQKYRAVGFGAGVPREKEPAVIRKKGFHINRLYSLLGKSGYLDQLLASFLASLKDKNPKVLQGFLNSALAEPWRPVKRTRPKNRIMELADERPRGVVPGGGAVSCLLAGVDTQDDGFYYEIRAFGFSQDFDSWCVREGFVISFEELEKVLWQDEYTDAGGRPYSVKLVCQDAMGHRTDEVYRFCRKHRGKMFPTQGVDSLTQPFRYSDIEFFPKSKKAIPGGIKLVRFDTNHFKNKLHTMLQVRKGDPGCWYYHSELTEEWAEQMTVEGIGESGKWENPGDKPNHAWDVAALLLLAAEIEGVRFKKRKKDDDGGGGPVPGGDPAGPEGQKQAKKPWIYTKPGGWMSGV